MRQLLGDSESFQSAEVAVAPGVRRLLPLLISISFHYGLSALASMESGLECSDGCGDGADGLYYLLNLLSIALAFVALIAHGARPLRQLASCNAAAGGGAVFVPAKLLLCTLPSCCRSACAS